MQGERSHMGLTQLRWVLADMGVEAEKLKRLGRRSPWLWAAHPSRESEEQEHAALKS